MKLKAKALSIRQPYAWLIVAGHKDVENRTWQTSHRGPFLIHASKTVEHEAVNQYKQLCKEQGVPWPKTLPTGAIVGVADLVDCVASHDSDWFTGPVGWVLENPGVLSTPIPYRGRPGLWTAEIDIEGSL
jgi:hypothetical protein